MQTELDACRSENSHKKKLGSFSSQPLLGTEERILIFCEEFIYTPIKKDRWLFAKQACIRHQFTDISTPSVTEGNKEKKLLMAYLRRDLFYCTFTHSEDDHFIVTKIKVISNK